MINKTFFGKLPDGREASLYVLQSTSGIKAVITPYGCRVVSLFTKDKNGDFGDVVLGHKTLEEYFGSDYFGAFIGRYGNRIGGAEFEIDGKSYKLEKNDGKNSLHGGSGGYHSVLWDVKATEDGEEPTITFSYESPDMDGGFPGNLSMTVKYTLTKNDELVMEYCAVSDKFTPFAPTNHSFFNITGNPQKDILNVFLTLNSSKITDITDDLIPTGEFIATAGTPFDFSKGKKLGDDMFSDEHTIALCGGFDHNFCVDGEGFRKFGEAYDPESGRNMEVFSDLPGIQLYTFNSTSGVTGKDGKEMKPHTAFCLETQFYPDSPHHKNFPFEYLQPGKPSSTKTVYKFSVR